MKLEDYLKNPCGKASLPYYKMKKINLPPNLKVVHERDHLEERSEAYFRLIHRLDDLKEVSLPEGYYFENIDVTQDKFLKEVSEMIARSYDNERLPFDQMKGMIESDVFDPDLWFVIRNEKGLMVASGISEFDLEAKEGVLEWIQVLPSYKRRGLGKALVGKSLEILKEKADFVTVSGRVYNTDSPEGLYRACGFRGHDVWHVIDLSK
jgi:ribosomal protein S18 acetylase RimI-like enzyme